MPKRLVGVIYGEAIPARAVQLRQGLPPRLDLAFPLSYGNSASAGNHLFASPDRTYGVGAAVASGLNFWIYPDLENLGSYVLPSTPFSGTAQCCAVSDTHYAIGGTGPLLFIFKKNGDLQTISTSGLGTVINLDFSPDGQYLGVVHNAAPYVRIYKLSDMSFVNGGAGATQVYYGCFSHDSSKFYGICNSGSVLVSKYAPETGVRTNVSTSNTHGGASSVTTGNRIARFPDGKTIIYASNKSSNGLSYLDSTNDSIILGPVISPSIGTTYTIAVPVHASDDEFYVVHPPGSSGRTVSRFRLSTKQMETSADEALVYRGLLYGATNAAHSLLVLDSGRNKISGTVRDISNLPAKRMVRAFQRSTGVLVAQTESDPVTGNYTLLVDNAGPFDVQFYTEAGELLNDLLYSKVEAEPIV